MAIQLYDAFVPTTRQMLQSVSKILGDAEVWAAENGKTPEEVLGARLRDDMLPLTFQIRSIVHHSRDVLAGVLSGEHDGYAAEEAGSFPESYRLLAAAVAALDSIDRDQLESRQGREVILILRERRLSFTAEDFLLSYAQPNFFFHVTTAYALLRTMGMPVGKRDYLGRLRLKP